MDFMGIGIMEVMVIIVVAIIILGPAKAAEMAKNGGKMAREVRRSFSDLSSTLSSTLDEAQWDESQVPPQSPGEAESDKDPKAPR